jgi:nucleoside-diphosphate-sugar epimerase
MQPRNEKFFPFAGKVTGARKAVGGLLNVLQAACDWQVPRVGIASTIGVYGVPRRRARCVKTCRCR